MTQLKELEIYFPFVFGDMARIGTVHSSIETDVEICKRLHLISLVGTITSKLTSNNITGGLTLNIKVTNKYGVIWNQQNEVTQDVYNTQDSIRIRHFIIEKMINSLFTSMFLGLSEAGKEKIEVKQQSNG